METLLAQHHAWIIFFGTFFLGETIILAAAALAAQGHFSVWSVVVWSYLGTVISDGGWFLLARPAARYLKSGARRERYDKVLAWLDRRFGARPERSLLFIKFVYGTRIATIVYLSLRRIGLWVFLRLNGLGTAMWLSVVVTVGWMAGKGIGSLSPELSKVEYLLPVILIVGLCLRELVKWTSRRALRR